MCSILDILCQSEIANVSDITDIMHSVMLILMP